MKIGYGLLLCVMGFCSCQPTTADKVKKGNKVISIDTRKVSTDVIFGKWIIDSLAEDRVITRRMEKTDSSYEGFKLDQEYNVLMVNGNAHIETARRLCDFELKGDSLFFIRHGRIFQRYGVEKLGKNVMALHGNYFITDNYKKKPSLYLTRRWK